MRFEPTAIAGLLIVTPEAIPDARGHFARMFCRDEFAAAGLVPEFRQSSISFNSKAGTVRGMHYSIGPTAETKLVRCTAGAILDALVDVRPNSPSFGVTVSVQLDAENRLALYVPHGVAHGFQTLRDATEVLYAIDRPYQAEAARGLRWDDPISGVEWPLPISVIADRDRTYPDFVAGRTA